MPEERPRSAARRIFTAVSVLVILIVVIGVPTAILAPVPEARASVVPEMQHTLAAADPRFASFGHSAVGVVGMDGVLATHGGQQPQSIASITKVVTALVVLEAKPLAGDEPGPTITYTQRDVSILQEVLDQDGSSAPVQAGWKLSERDSLIAMLLPSANNYAESLAIWAYGSVPRYLVAARAFLAAHHLSHTTLVDTNGLSASDRSTPSDLVELGELALAQPVLASIVKEQTETLPQVGEVDNTNKLLGTDRIDGIKTGTGNADGSDANLLFSAKQTVGTRTVRVVGVVLGAASHDQLDATVPALLASVRHGLHDVALATAAQSFGTYHTKWGYTAHAVASRSASLLVWGTKQVVRRTDVQPIRGGQKGERVGTVTYVVGSQTTSVPLVLDRDVLAAPMWWRLTNPIR